MSKIEVDAIDKQSGSTLTLGGSGTAVTLACGATQTGFGRTGTVNWQTGSIKTSTFTAANGEGYFANTSGGAFVMNLPAGTAGNIVSVVDYTNTFQTNNLTITPNGSQKIGGVNANFIASTEGQSLTFVYVDDTEGWKNVQDSTSNAIGNANLVATGGTITECGNFKIHTFTGPGTFTVSKIACVAANNTVGYQVVAGGGGGGAKFAAGGGAGGYREGRNVPVDNFTASPLVANSPTNAITLTAQSYPIVVGGGGVGTPASATPKKGGTGGVSTFATITSAGGGGGGSEPTASDGAGNPGGSGGGGVYNASAGGSGNTPPTTPPQGNNGGAGNPGTSAKYGGGGGGGAGAVGTAGNACTSGPGGAGVSSSITGASVARAGGGGAGGNSAGSTPGTGGTGGGGAGAPTAGGSASGVAGTANTGGGGGGATGGNTPSGSGGTGGGGIVIIRYKFQ